MYLWTFFKWCCEHGVLEDNPLDGFKKCKYEGRQVTIDEEMLARLITLPNQETFAGLRDYALFLMFLDCGIRPKESFRLMETDFHPRAYQIRIDATEEKTRVSRTLLLSPITVDAISELISIHPKEWKGKAPIFLQRMDSGVGVNKAIKSATKLLKAD